MVHFLKQIVKKRESQLLIYVPAGLREEVKFKGEICPNSN